MSGWQPQEYDPRYEQPATPPQWQAQPGYGPPPGWQQYLPGYGQPQYAPPQAPPPRRSWIRRHKILTGLGALFLFFISIGIGSALGNSSSQNGTGASAFSPTTQAAAPGTSAAAATKAAAKQTVTFEVTGSGAADVTYGPAGTSVSGTVPMKVTKPLGNPMYYSLTAQLQGGGTVTCKIKVDGKVIAESVASGGYNIADCEISKDMFSGDWTDTNAG